MSACWMLDAILLVFTQLFFSILTKNGCHLFCVGELSSLMNLKECAWVFALRVT